MHRFLTPFSVTLLGFSVLCQAQLSTTATSSTPTGAITTSPPKTTERYFLDDCPNATGAGFALCALSKSEDIWISEGPCQGAATKGDDDVFSSCYCRMMVEWGPCYETVCPQSVMSRYSSSVSRNECPASVWATITAEAGNGGNGGNGGGGGSGPAPTAGSESGLGGSTKPNGASSLAAPVIVSLVALSAGVFAVMF
ncbi:hypothetical protein B0H67DRAFT_551144 [Lasiosphaeris hirsuta]|uniref:Uncharacterized protein n=1 Tax=Lasiosphaeris hirsuta TaxID=260670 RepID=A0AA40B100_9PEZI|nr:hypothetical protein B0H67DRAFT_551144 [Lasiosphaeris hirsuta]